MIETVIFDWGGTTVDYGCFATVVAMRQAFLEQGISVTDEKIRQGMGFRKVDHIKKLLELPHVQRQWQGRLQQPLSIETVRSLYQSFQKNLFENLPEHAEVKPGVLEVVDYLKRNKINIGSTTGYTRDVMTIIRREAGRLGYHPEYVVTPEDTLGIGRPAPYMIFKNMEYFETYQVRQVLKVGDTLADIAEGKNAGVISVGVIEGSSLAGVTQAQFNALSTYEQLKLKQQVKEQFVASGADYVLDSLQDLPKLIQQFNG
ncbi:MAG: phosphonoacetaldehyde hydrolase [Enterococcus sp.]